MPAQALSAFLADAAPTVNGPLHFLSLVESFLRSAVGQIVGTADQRDAVIKVVMEAYDATSIAIGRSNIALGALFAAMRPTVESLLNTLLTALTPPPAPTPAPVVVPVPQGSTQGASA